MDWRTRFAMLRRPREARWALFFLIDLTQHFVPSVPSWELPDFYRRLKTRLLEMEAAWEAGELQGLLERPDTLEILGSSVAQVYQHLLQATPSGQPFRRASVHVVAESPKTSLSVPTCEFPARVEHSPDPKHPERRRSTFWVDSREGPRALSPDQVVALRTWGIGLRLDDPEVEAAVVQRLVFRVLQRLASDLSGLHKVERWLTRAKQIHPGTRVAPDLHGRRFEQLMVDILNEQTAMARHASLYEDFVEKTDLRVQAAGLGRRRGARVQVAQTSEEHFLREKVAQIRYSEEFVILSPLSLAQALASPQADALMSEGEVRALWDALPSTYATIPDLARVIKQVFLKAVDQPCADPAGPHLLVPPSLRALLRHYVVSESFRSTAQMRARVRAAAS